MFLEKTIIWISGLLFVFVCCVALKYLGVPDGTAIIINSMIAIIVGNFVIALISILFDPPESP